MAFELGLGMNRQKRTLALAAFLVGLVSTELQASTLKLQWDASPNATGYILSYGTTAGVNGPTTITVGAVTEVQVPNLAPGTRYYFSVRAIGAAGQSPYSGQVSGIPADLTVAVQGSGAVTTADGGIPARLKEHAGTQGPRVRSGSEQGEDER